MLYGIIWNWYCMDCLNDINNIKEICNISVKIWPLTSTSFSFQVIFLNCLAFLSEDSVTGNYCYMEIKKPKNMLLNLNSFLIIFYKFASYFHRIMLEIHHQFYKRLLSLFKQILHGLSIQLLI